MTATIKHSHLIGSHNHPDIKRIRRLRDRAMREQTGQYYVEGLRFVANAFQSQAPVDMLVVCPQQLDHPYAERIIHHYQRVGVPVLEVTPEILNGISAVDDPQGIGAVVRQRWESLTRVTPGNELCWVALQIVRSAGNLGTILRTSEAIGGAGVIVLDEATDPYDPACVRATMGAIFRQRFIRTSIEKFRRWKQRHNYQLIGTSPSATTDYQDVHYHTPTIILMGEERKGLPQSLQALCDTVVQIPMVGESDSLNLAVATGVMLYEVFNQRRKKETSH
uniref:rRNA methyltransferase n=1 Tax=Thermosporothrix sp. COM3 TaxID=2490863 RepID=A0A455SPS4_9CHLR|nr:rRNA methyltransferase [Thermosporothrix sp. COM3]